MGKRAYHTELCTELSRRGHSVYCAYDTESLNSVQLLHTQSVGTPSAVRTVALLLIGGLNCLPAGLCWDLGLIYFFGCCLVNSCGGLIK